MMKLFYFCLALMSSISLRAAQPRVQGTEVVSAVGGNISGATVSGELPARAYVKGTNVVIDYNQPVTYWDTTNAPAVRWSYSNLPAGTNTAPKNQIVIVGQPGMLLTNVADGLKVHGNWGVLTETTNFFLAQWNGLSLDGWQDPNQGIIVVAPGSADTNLWAIMMTNRATGSYWYISTNASMYATNPMTGAYYIINATNAHFSTNMIVDGPVVRFTGIPGGTNYYLGIAADGTLSASIVTNGGGGIQYTNTGAYILNSGGNGTNTTLLTPTIQGAMTFPAGVRQAFVPNGTSPGIGVGLVAGDPTISSDGDIWFDSTGKTFRGKANSIVGSFGYVSKVLASDQVFTSNTAFTDMTGGGVAVAANHTYAIEIYIQISQVSTVAGWKFQLTGPASPTAVIYGGSTPGNGTISLLGPVTGFSATLSGGTGAAANRAIILTGTLVNGANAGTVTCQYAQSVSDSNATTFRTGSRITIHQLD